jgi:hypothetical protein
MAHGQLIKTDSSTTTRGTGGAAADCAAPGGFEISDQGQLSLYLTALALRAGDLVQFGHANQFFKFFLAILANKSV